MLKNSIACLVLVLSFMTTMSAKALGPDISVYDGEELKWENGAYGYHVMVTKLPPEYKDCIENSGSSDNVSLSADAIPQDAYVERAFLIWGGTQNVDKIDELTDSEVTLVFNSYDIEFETITVTGYKVTEPQGFEFDSILETYYYEKPFFTYRADVTGFFEKLREKGREFGVEYDGESFVGDYHLSGLDCWSFGTFAESGSSIRMWALLIIYKSYLLTPQNIKIFDGLEELTDPIDPEDFGCVDTDQKCTLLTNNGAFDLFSFENDNWNIANLLITSEETTSSNFDIPNQPELVACTPANIPVDPENPDSKWCDNGLDHVFAIRIQNWGDDITPPVIVKSKIPEGMEYAKGSTEYATEFTVFDERKIAKKWSHIPDNEGVFPLIKGYKIADNMNSCGADSDYLSCENTIMIRFRATIKNDARKNEVLENIANIDSYSTNLGIPLKLKLANSGCVSNQDDINLDDCGGRTCSGCIDDEDCLDGYICDGCNCIPDPNASISDSDIENIDDDTVDDSDIEAVVTDEDFQKTDSETKSDGCAITNL